MVESLVTVVSSVEGPGAETDEFGGGGEFVKEVARALVLAEAVTLRCARSSQFRGFKMYAEFQRGAAYQLSLEDLSRAFLLRVTGGLFLVGQLIESLGRLVWSRELVQAVGSRQGVGRLELEGFGVAVEGDDELGAGRERELVGWVAGEDCVGGAVVSISFTECLNRTDACWLCGVLAGRGRDRSGRAGCGTASAAAAAAWWRRRGLTLCYARLLALRSN